MTYAPDPATPSPATRRCPRTVGRLSPNRPAALVAGLVLPVLYLSACASVRYTDLLNPTVKVEVEHPPSVGFVVDQVVFASEHSPSLLESLGFSGPTSQARCGAELVQALTQVLIEGGLQVACTESGGDADALITVNVTRCDTEQDTTQTSREIVETVRNNTRRRIVPEYHSRTRVSFRATFEVTDLSTGLVAVSRVFAHEPEMTYSSEEGYPEFPSLIRQWSVWNGPARRIPITALSDALSRKLFRPRRPPPVSAAP